jgi:pimeloyl-ACP methyl ester carboxylesterase
MANDIIRFMYEHKISMATLGGHGLGAKIALATACYHYDKVTGTFGIDSTPMNQYYF